MTTLKKGWVGPLVQSTKGKLPWVCDYACPLSGKKKRRKIAEAAANQKDRERLYHDFGRSLRDGRLLTRENATVNDALDVFLKDCEQRLAIRDRMEHGTFIRIQSSIKVHLRPDLGHILLKDFTSPLIQDYIYRKATTHRAKWSDLRQTIKSALERAVWADLLLISPLDVKKVRQPKRPKSVRTIPTIEEGRALYHAIEHEGRSNVHVSEHAYISRMTTVSLAMFGGMSAGEMAGLQWEFVNMLEADDGPWIWVQHSLSRYGPADERLKGPKALSRHRYIPIGEAIYRWLSETAKRDGHPRSGYVLRPEPLNRNRNWTNDEGNHLLRSMTSQFKAAQVRCGFVNDKGKACWCMHELRHYAGSVWLASGDYRLEDVSRLMGHGKFETTQKYYIHHIKKQNLQRDRAMMARVSKLHRLPSAPPPLALAKPMRHSCDIDGEGFEI